MDSASATTAPPKQATAKVALAGLDAAAAAILQDCFRQFGISAVALGAPDSERLAQENFAAYVVPLDDGAPETLAAIHQSPGEPHPVVYGICGSLRQAIPYSCYGINAVFLHPVERQAALEVVRNTHLLVQRELRRYVRLPLVAPAVLRMGSEIVHTSTVEISTGGAALRTRAAVSVPQPVQIGIHLPRVGELSFAAVVCWIRREESLVGVRFEPGDHNRKQLRQWIDNYLGDN